jgi:hypothetical protein
MKWIIKMMNFSFDVIFVVFIEMMLQQTIYTTENTTGTMHHYLYKRFPTSHALDLKPQVSDFIVSNSVPMILAFLQNS